MKLKSARVINIRSPSSTQLLHCRFLTVASKTVGIMFVLHPVMPVVTGAAALLLLKVCKCIHHTLRNNRDPVYILLSCHFCFSASEPPVFIKLFESREVIKGSDVILEGSVSGTAPFELCCFRDSMQIRKDRRHNIDVTNNVVTVEIVKFESGDAGRYQCTVENDVGQTSCECEIKMKG